MEITLEQYQNIQRYLDGGMDAAQAAVFQQELETNADLKDAYAFERELREHIGTVHEAEEIAALNDLPGGRAGADDDFFRDLIQRSGAEWRAAHPAGAASRAGGGKVISFTWATAIAACLLLAIGGSVLFIHFGGPSASPADLFAAYFKKDALPADSSPMLAQALTDYKNDKYATLQRYDLENLPIAKGGDDQRQKTMELGYYYRGVSWLATGEPDKAIADLQWVIGHAQTPDLVWKAQWYEALALLKTSNIPAATELLRSISANTRAVGYNHQAAALLNQLSR